MATTWILILTLFGSSSQSGKAIAMHEFASRDSCMAAAKAWLDEVPRYKGTDEISVSGPVRALCVPQSLARP